MPNFGSLTLGQILKELKSHEPGAEVYFDFEHARPVNIDSYRGYYEDLSLGFDFSSQPMKCEELVKLLRGCIGRSFEGYKGGEYTMDEETTVWVANHGNTGGTAITRISGTSLIVVLHTELVD